jgi:hypothetical protein
MPAFAAFQSDCAGKMVTLGLVDRGFKYGLTRASKPSRATISQDFHVDRVVRETLSPSILGVFMSSVLRFSFPAISAFLAITAFSKRAKKVRSSGGKKAVGCRPQLLATHSAKEDPAPGKA